MASTKKDDGWEACRLLLLKQHQSISDIHQMVSNLCQHIDLLKQISQAEPSAKAPKKAAAKRGAAAKPTQDTSLSSVKFDNIIGFFTNVFLRDNSYFDGLLKDKEAILERAKAALAGKTGDALLMAKASIFYDHINNTPNLKAKLLEMQNIFKKQYPVNPNEDDDSEIDTLEPDGDSDDDDTAASASAAAPASAKAAGAAAAPAKRPPAKRRSTKTVKKDEVKPVAHIVKEPIDDDDESDDD